MKKSFLFIYIFLYNIIANNTIFAQNISNIEELKIRPIGRVHIDAGLFDDNLTIGGPAISDARIGIMLNYKDYSAKIDIGSVANKLSVKDVFIQKYIDTKEQHSIRAGYFLHQFGLQGAMSASLKMMMEDPSSNTIFSNKRLLGVMWTNNANKIYTTLGVFAENDALMMKNQDFGKVAWGAMGRFVYRPFYNDDFKFQVGLSRAIEMPRYNEKEELNHSSFVFQSNFPTKIYSKKAISAVVDDSKFMIKYSPEILLSYKNFALETQFFHMHIRRNNNKSAYNAYGAYAYLRTILLGANYRYDKANAVLATPSVGSLELVAGYDYTNLNDRKAEIKGGMLSDFSLTMNYYINKYMIARLRYSNTSVYDSPIYNMNTERMNILQARVQILF